MAYKIKIAALLIVISFALYGVRSGRRRHNYRDSLLFAYVLRSLLTEILAVVFAQCYGNNLWIYTLSEPVGLFLACLYFENNIPVLKKYQAGLIAGITGILMQLLLIVLHQKPDVNGLFEEYESTTIIGFSLLGAYTHCRRYGYPALCRQPDCAVSLLFLLFFSGCFMIRAYPVFLPETDKTTLHNLYFIVLLLNLIFYTGTGLIYISQKTSKQQLHV